MLTTQDPHKVFEADYDDWTPPEQLLVAIQDKKLKTRDKAELVIGTYAIMHRGIHPSAAQVAKVLGKSKRRAQDVMEELLITGHAEKIHGKFVLKQGVYQNPLVAQFLSVLGFEVEI